MKYLADRSDQHPMLAKLPLGWWHQVTALDVSLSFSFSNLAMPNQFSYTNPEIHNW